MKKLLLAVVALLFACLLNAAPSVAITVDGVTSFTITCSFSKNVDCTEYYIVASEPSGIDPWIGSPFGGATIEETIEQFGIRCVGDTNYTWTKMSPNTMYVIYVTAKDAGGSRVLCTDTVYTEKSGGHGTSVITLSVRDITDCGATLTATPNDQTMLFKDFVIEKWMYNNIHSYYEIVDAQTADEMTNDSVFRLLDKMGSEFYEEDEYVWTVLYSGYEYYFVAAGMNADSVWGEMVMEPFTTTGDPVAVENVEMNTVSVYPNPASEYILVNGVETGEMISVVDLSGNVVIEQKATSSDVRISLDGIVPGVYMVRTATAVNKFIVR